MQVAKNGRHARQHCWVADRSWVERPTFDEPGYEKTALVIHQLGREVEEPRCLVAHDLVAAVDSEEREFLADPDKIRLPAGSTAKLWFDRPPGIGLIEKGPRARPSLRSRSITTRSGRWSRRPSGSRSTPKARFQSTLSLEAKPARLDSARSRPILVDLDARGYFRRCGSGVGLRSIEEAIILIAATPTRWLSRLFMSGNEGIGWPPPRSARKPAWLTTLRGTANRWRRPRSIAMT